jgi:hypothetical protein
MNNRKTLVIIALAVLLCGLLAFRGTKAEDDGKIKVTVEGGYAALLDGTVVTEVAPGEYVNFLWALPRDEQIAKIVCTKKMKDGTVEVDDYASASYFETTATGEIVYMNQRRFSEDVKECVVTVTTEKIKPIEFDLPDGIWTGYDVGSRLHHLFAKFSEKASDDYWDIIDLDGDGSFDIKYSWGSSEIGYTAFIAHLGESNLQGDYVWRKSYEEEDYYYYAYAPDATVIFHFDSEPPQKEYSISVVGGGGYAVDRDGNPVNKLATGDPIRLVFPVLEGKYVAGWSLNASEGADAYGHSIMPRKDVICTADIREQEPYIIDLTKGYFKKVLSTDEDTSSILDALRELMQIEQYFVSGSYDLDGDGSKDISIAALYDTCDDFLEILYIVPLSSSNLRGDYVLTGLNHSPHWPVTFRFGEKVPDQEYSLTVNGGHAENEKHETVQKAAPGTMLQIVPDNPDNQEYYYPKAVDSDGYYGERACVFYELWNYIYESEFKTNFIMPACDITFSFETEEKDPTITPTPNEVTPNPTPGEISPTPTEQAETPTPTEGQGVTKEATPTIAPTGTEPVKDETKQVKGEDKEQKGGFNPLYVIIPITVIILGAAIAAYVMMNRKQPAKPAQKETIDEGEDDYE